MEKIQETFNKDEEELKRNQATMKNTINEIKNSAIDSFWFLIF